MIIPTAVLFQTGRHVECGVWNAECGVWSAECGTRSVECGVWNVECGVRNAEFSAPKGHDVKAQGNALGKA